MFEKVNRVNTDEPLEPWNLEPNNKHKRFFFLDLFSIKLQ